MGLEYREEALIVEYRPLKANNVIYPSNMRLTDEFKTYILALALELDSNFYDFGEEPYFIPCRKLSRVWLMNAQGLKIAIKKPEVLAEIFDSKPNRSRK